MMNNEANETNDLTSLLLINNQMIKFSTSSWEFERNFTSSKYSGYLIKTSVCRVNISLPDFDNSLLICSSLVVLGFWSIDHKG